MVSIRVFVIRVCLVFVRFFVCLFFVYLIFFLRVDRLGLVKRGIWGIRLDFFL